VAREARDYRLAREAGLCNNDTIQDFPDARRGLKPSKLRHLRSLEGDHAWTVCRGGWMLNNDVYRLEGRVVPTGGKVR